VKGLKLDVLYREEDYQKIVEKYIHWKSVAIGCMAGWGTTVILHIF
jgi:hypothetical protein